MGHYDTARTTIRVVETFEIKWQEISDNFCVFGVWKTTEINGIEETEAQATLIRQGFTDTNTLHEMKRSRNWNAELIPHFDSEVARYYRPILITSEGREFIRNNGSPWPHSKIWDKLEQERKIIAGNSNVFIEAFEAGATIDDLHYIGFDHSIVNNSGHPITAAQLFSLENGGLSSVFYDLKKVINHLKDNAEAEIVYNKDENGLIHPFPDNHSRDEDCRGSMVVQWRPSENSWNHLIAQAKNVDSNPASRFSAKDLLEKFDVLGLKRAGCRKTQRQETTDRPQYFMTLSSPPNETMMIE